MCASDDATLLDGVIAQLTRECGGTVDEKGVVEITASSCRDGVEAKNAANLWTNSCFISEDEPNSWICYDFKSRLVTPTSYSIRSHVGAGFPKSWVLEVSNDGHAWTVIDRRDDNEDLRAERVTRNFAISTRLVKGFRFIRLRETGKNHHGDDRLILTAFEILENVPDPGPCVSEEVVSCGFDGHRVACTFSTQDQKLAPLHMKSGVSWVVDQAMAERVIWSDESGLVSRHFLSSVRSICVPKSVRTIPDRCFCSCNKLFRITFAPGSKLEKIGSMAFGSDWNSGCPIREIHIPDSVTEIGEKCFLHCWNLFRITFAPGSKLVKIGSMAFGSSFGNGCPIQEIHIPDSVTEIGEECFFNCKKLFRITFAPGSKLEKIGSMAFSSY